MNTRKTSWIVAAMGMFLLLGCAYRAAAVTAETGPFKMQIGFPGYTNQSEVLTNFPVLVVFSNGMGNTDFDFQRYPFLSASGWDLRFATNAASTNYLNYEIESWNTNGQSFVWVQVPLLLTNNASIWASWGDSVSSNQLACTTNGAVWTNGHVGVWHLAETSGTSVANSSGYGASLNGTISGTVNLGSNGVVSRSVSFQGNSDASARITVPHNAALAGPSQMTISFWFNTRSDGAGTYGRFVSKNEANPYQLLCEKTKLAYKINNSAAQVGPTRTNNVWNHATLRCNAAGTACYINGAFAFGSTNASPLTSNSNPVVFGNRESAADRALDGLMDEIRISNVERSSNWVWACYQNMASNSAFNAYGTPAYLLSITNRAATDPTAHGATLRGYLVSTGGFPTTVYANWGTNTAFGASTNLGVRGTGTVTVAVSGLDPSTRYYFTFMASNAVAVCWAPTTNEFETIPAGELTIVNPLHPSVGLTGAVLTADLNATGSAPVTVYGYWGTNTTNWTETNLGPWDVGTVTNDLTGQLQPNTTYSYAFMASNEVDGVKWTTTNSFRTLNRAPIASDGTATTVEDTATNLTMAGSDPDGDALSFTNAALPGHGTLNWTSASNVTYTPAANYTGLDQFTVKAWDGRDWSAGTGTISVTITPVNDAPVANNQVVTTGPGLPLATTLTGGYDVEGSNLTYTILQGPSHAQSFSAVDASVAYTPSPGYEGQDTFTFKVNDGQLDSAAGTVTVAVGWFTLGSNQNLNGWADLVGTNDAITSHANGVYNWANKDGAGTPAMYGLKMNGYNISIGDGTGFRLLLNDSPIAGGGNLSSCNGALASGSIVVTNASAVAVSNITTYTTATALGINAGSVALIGVDAGNAANTLTLNSVDTGTGPGAAAGSISLQGFYGITISGTNTPRAISSYVYKGAGLYTLVTVYNDSTAGSVGIGTAGSPIGLGGVTIPYGISTRGYDDSGVYRWHRAGSISIYTAGPVSVGGLDAKSDMASNSVTVVNNGDASLGVILASCYRETSGGVTLTGGGNGTGTLSVVSVDASAGSSCGGVTLRNYRQVSISGSATNGSAVAGILNGSVHSPGPTVITNIGLGGVSIPYGWYCRKSNTAYGPEFSGAFTLSTLGPVALGDLDNRALGPWPDLGANISVAGGEAMTIGTILGMQNYTTPDNVTLTGGGTNSGALTVTAINVGSTGGGGGAIAISNFTGVTIFGTNVWSAGTNYSASLISAADASSGGPYNGGSVTITGVGTGGVRIAQGLDLRTRTAGTGGRVTIACVGDVNIDGAISLGSTAIASNGVLTVTNTGSGAAIRLSDLDLGLVKVAAFCAGGGQTVITNALLNFPTNAPANGTLDAAPNQFVRYDGTVAANAYLLATSNGVYTLKSGGILTWQSSAAITNAGYGGLSSTGAVLLATLVSTGGSPTEVYCFWGTNTAPWTWSTNLGTRTAGAVTNAVGGLESGTTNWFRFAASNALGFVWAPTTNSFVTLSEAYPPPTSVDAAVTTLENTATNITLTGNTENPAPTWSLSEVLTPAHGTLSAQSGLAVTYTPNVLYSGPDSFTFKVFDGVNLSTNAWTVSINVTFVNQPPTVSDQSLTVPLDLPRVISLAGSDVHGLPLTFSIVQNPAHAQSCSLDGSNVTYTPVTGYEGSDSFTFKANNGLDSNTGTVTLMIGWFTLGSSQSLNGWADLVGTNDAITSHANGVYNWANKDGAGTPAMYGLKMNGYDIATSDGTNFVLSLNCWPIVGGGNLSSCNGALASGSIVVTNASAVAVSNVTTYTTATADGTNAGSVALIGVDAGNAANTLTLSSVDTGTGPGAASGAISLQGFYGITIGGTNTPRANSYGYKGAGLYTLSTPGHASTAGSVGVGTAGSPIGLGGVTIPYGISTRGCDDSGVYRQHRAGPISIYTAGPVSVGGLDAKSDWTGNSVTVANNGDASLGVILASCYGETSGGVTLTGGGNGTGTLSVVSMDASAGSSCGGVTLRNYRQVNISGSATNGSAVAGILNGSVHSPGPTVITNIGLGGVSIPYGWYCRKSNTAYGPEAAGALTLSTLGPVALGDLDNRALGPRPDLGANISVAGGGVMTIGTILGMQNHITPDNVTLMGGGTNSGALTVTAINVGSTGGGGGAIAISNFTGVTIFGTNVWSAGTNYSASLISAADASSGGPYNAGSVAITGVGTGGVRIAQGLDLRTRTAGTGGRVTIACVGDVNINGAINLGSTAIASNGVLTVTNTGSGAAIRLSDLDLGLVRVAAFYAGGGQTTITNSLLNFATNFVGGTGTPLAPYLTSQTAVRAPSGQTIAYDPNVAANGYLNGRTYRVADLAGNAQEGGLLLPSEALIPTGSLYLFR